MACAHLKHPNIYAIDAKGMGNDLGENIFLISEVFTKIFNFFTVTLIG
jgi:hypothetical protein